MIGEKAIGEVTNRYRELERESSSLLLDHDSRLVLGRYEEAAYYGLQAGRHRASMGKILFDAGDRVRASEDWLSASQCFLLAAAEDQARTVLDALHRLNEEGDLESRPDIRDALSERDQGMLELVAKRTAFLRQLALPDYKLDGSNLRALEFLLEQRRQLPGYALLHYAISRQAADLGERELSDRHLVWAATFDAGNANLIALLGYLHLRYGRRDRAITLGNEFLEANPSDAGAVRIMLANALGGGHDEPVDRERALDVLRPLINDYWADRQERIAALAISAALCYETGRKEDLLRYVDALRSIDRDLGAGELSAYTYVKLCEESLLGAGGVNDPKPHGQMSLPESKRQQFFRGAMQLTTRLPWPLAA